MNQQTAIKILLCLLVAAILFHICIVVKIIPYDITWGGRLKNDSEMYTFEAVSILINLFLVVILLVKGKFIKAILPMKVVNIALWIFFALFILNTVGNIFAQSNFEKFFSILTIAFSILIWVILQKSQTLTDK